MMRTAMAMAMMLFTAGLAAAQDNPMIAALKSQAALFNGNLVKSAAKVPDDFELLFDWKGPEEVRVESAANLTYKAKKAGQWQRERAELGSSSPSLTFTAADKLELRNIYIREVKEKK